jgi:TrmH family RNA methyltransferase
VAAARLTNRQHAVVRRCRQLAVQGTDDGAVLLDGAHLLAAALETHVPIEAVVTDGRHADLAQQAERAGALVFEATGSVFDAVSPVRSPTGIVAIARWSPAPAERLLVMASDRLLGLVGVQDPGNVGSAIRTADALGATGVICFDQSASPAGYKALRGAMGSTFRLPVASARLAEAVPHARQRGIRIAATVSHGGEPPTAAALDAPVLILLGNEGTGLPDALVAEADVRITVPMRIGVDSLNVAVTAALLLWEASDGRQRSR